jgi:type I site-specific restriction endonuclease
MRDVQSRVYFEQMKGRGTRVISPTDLNAVTPDASRKTHFVIVDVVGVCENDKTDSRPLERKRSVPFDKLLQSVAMGIRDNDTLTSLAGRLARLDREIDEKDRKEIEYAAGGIPLKQIINKLLDAVDPDKQLEKAKEIFKWQAYEALEKSKVKTSRPEKLLTNILSLIRFAIGESDVLEPFPETVNHRFDNWLAQQEKLGKKFSPEQMEWLTMIKDHIATSLNIEMDDFEYAPFHEKGGLMKVYRLFGNDLNNVLEELNEVLAA